MTTTLENSIFVNAPVPSVESVLYDGTSFPRWVVGVTRAQPDGVFPNPGGAVDLVYSVAGLNFDVVLKSVDVNPGSHATTEFDGMITGRNYWTFQPEDDGTWVTCVFEYDVPGGGLGQAIDHIIFEKKNAENLARGMTNLKVMAEG
jgi:hypothetical protein